MHRTSDNPSHRLACSAAALALLLAACDRPAPPGQTPEPVAPPDPEVSAPIEAPAPPAAPDAASVAPEAAAPSAPVAAAKPAPEPSLSGMSLAQASGKIGVPVDLRYQFDGDAMTGQTVLLHLAAVPRVAGSNLAVSIKQEEGILAKASAMAVQKASASTAYRQQLAVSRQSGSPDELRVLVTMDLPEGSAFGWYSVPFKAAPATGKQAAIKQQ